MCRPRYPISPGSTDDPFALLEWPSDDPERVSVHSGLTPFTVPVGRSPMQPFSPAGCVPDRWVSGLYRPSPATIPPPGTTSPSRPPRLTVRAGERGLGVHVPGPPCNRFLEGMNGLSDGCVRRTFGALAGYGVRIPRPSPGVRAPASDANSGSCVALAEVWRTLRPLQPRRPSPRCEQAVFTSRHRGPDRSPVGGCGPVW